MVARPWSSSLLSCGEHRLFRCEGTLGILSRPRRGRIPPLEIGGANGAPLDVGGTLVLPISRGGILPLSARDRIPSVPSHRKRRRSPQERREEFRGRATIPRVPQMSQYISGKPVFPALPRLSSCGSSHTTVARGTALWESLEGKPQIILSTRREARHFCYSSGGKHTGMPPLETRTDSLGQTPKVPQDPCQHWRGILRFRHRLHTRS